MNDIAKKEYPKNITPLYKEDAYSNLIHPEPINIR